jgi:hypothetical protein
MSEVRADKLQGLWADDATVVAVTPVSPSTGTAYRNTASDATVGFQFLTKSPSEVANQWMYTASKLLAQLETMGTLGWNTLTTYQVGAIAMASDGAIYQCIQTALNKDPTTQSSYWTKLDVLNRALTSISNITTVAMVADGNVKSVPDVVTSYWVASDGNSWYRKYKSGWLEQGGVLTSALQEVNQTINFPTVFTTTKYTFVSTGEYTTDFSNAYMAEKPASRTVALIVLLMTIPRTWYACGY